MNEAYLKDIEKKNVFIKPDETIEDLMKQVKSYKDEKTPKKGRYSERFKSSVKKIKSDKEEKDKEQKTEKETEERKSP